MPEKIFTSSHEEQFEEEGLYECIEPDEDTTGPDEFVQSIESDPQLLAQVEEVLGAAVTKMFLSKPLSRFLRRLEWIIRDAEKRGDADFAAEIRKIVDFLLSIYKKRQGGTPPPWPKGRRWTEEEKQRNGERVKDAYREKQAIEKGLREELARRGTLLP